MKKIFTFLVAFLTTVSGAVWGQEYGSSSNPLDLNGRSESIRITDDKQEWYITSTSETNNVGIIIQGPSGSGDVIYPRIHLINVQAIDVPSTAIEIHDRAQPTLILEGENKIYSDDGPAIYVQNLPNTKLNIEGTGSLEIIMTHSDNVAIGNSSGGADRPADCGGITVNSGTVVTNGVIGSMCTYDFTVNNNAVFIVNNLDKSPGVGELKLNGGIWGENPDGIGYIQGDERTLDSPLPDGYKINLESGKKLTIGDDQILNEDQLIDNGGQIKGYKVVYSSPEIDNVTTAALPTTKFVGSNYKVEAWDDQAKNSDKSTTYERIDQWLLNENGSSWISTGSAIGALGDYTMLSNIPTKNYQAVWYLLSKSININLTGEGKFAGSFALWYPAEPEMLFSAEEQTSGALADAGLEISEDDSRMISGLDAPLTITEGTHEVKLNLLPYVPKNAPTGLTTTLTVEVNIDALDLSDDAEVKVTLGTNDNLTYDGKNKEIDIDVNNAANNLPIAERYYSVVFKKQTAEGQCAEEELSEICDAGTYKVIVKANDIEGQVLVEGSQKEAGTVTINPATLKVSKVSNVEWNIKDGGTPAYKDAQFTLGTIYSVGETKDDVSINTNAESFNGSVDGETWETTPGTYIVNYSGLELTGARAFNYALDPATAGGKLIVSVQGSDKDPIDDDGEDPLITGAGDWENKTLTYDGKLHPLTAIEVKNGTETERVSISLANVEITYSYKQTEEAQETTPEAVQNAGTYTATFTFPENEYGYKGIGKVSLTIDPATLTATTTDAMPQIGVGESLEDINISSKDATQYIKFNGLQNGEKAAYTGTLKANKDLDTSAEGELENAYTVDVTLAPEGTFDPNNYTTPSYDDIKVSAVVGKITINPGGDGEEGDDVIGGEDENNDGELDFILIHPKDEGQYSVYDGEPHGLDVLYVGEEKYRLDKGTDYTVSYEGFGADEEPVNAGEYRATITLSEDSKYQLEGDEQSFDLTIHIAERPVTVGFDLPASIDASTKTLDASDYAVWQEEGVVPNEGLVNDEEPICEGTLFLVESEDYPGYFNVYLDKKTFKVEDNPSSSFLVSNYIISVETKDGKIELEENGEGGETLPDDPNNPDDPIIDGPDEDDPTGGIEIDDSGSTGGSGISTKRYRLYLANQDYLNTGDYKKYYDELGLVLHSRHNQKYTTNTDKSFTIWYTQDGEVNAGGFRVFMSNHANGEYKEVKLDEVSGYYQIRNVTSNVYVKLCWSNGHPVANEDITATDARAYAQPNKIVVITPQPTDVQIISMAGAVVATDKVIGQREFTNLTEGVYIVRMGETVVKLQVRK